tara:strand:- start:534 stop:746 length:213 start_codon:yes stop_codon:yes gene_type:complete
MGLITLILNKVFFFVFFMAVLNTIRHIYNVIQSYYMSDNDENVRYLLEQKDLAILAASIAIILTAIVGLF